MILKSLEDKKIFIHALLNPLLPNDKLRKAQLTYNQLIESGILVKTTKTSIGS